MGKFSLRLSLILALISRCMFTASFMSQPLHLWGKTTVSFNGRLGRAEGGENLRFE
jgi:hypothetical protein